MIPFAKAVTALGKARDEARQALRAAEACALAATSARVAPPTKVRKHLINLENAIVEVKKHHALAVVDEARLEGGAQSYVAENQAQVAEQTRLQRAFVEELSAVLAHLGWEMAEVRRRVAIAEAHDALGGVRAAADSAEAEPLERFSKRIDKIIDGLARAMTAAKRCIAATIADEKRYLKVAAEVGEPALSELYPPRPPDRETLAGTVAAQRAAVEDLKRQLGDVNDRVELLKRKANIIAARRKLGL